MNTTLLFIVLITCFTFFTYSQHTNVIISDDNAPEEPTIVLDPCNPEILIAGANINNYFYSHDSGYTWHQEMLTSSYGVWGDPCVAVDTAGDFYFFHLSNPDEGDWLDRIVCQKTTDNGETWSDGSYMGLNGSKDQDKEWVSIDRNNNNIYVTWSEFDSYGSSASQDSSYIRFSRSTDGGQTWSDAIRINKKAGDCLDDDNTVEGAVPVVGPSGEVFVSWVGEEGIMFDRSYDQGQTWLDEDIHVCNNPGGWNYNIPGISRCNGLPVIVCDTSGGLYHGNIYINWTDQRNGESDTDVFLIKSSDNGQTWSNIKRVNNDPAGRQQFFTWMAIDQVTGYLYFVFYDRRNYNDNRTDVYMAVSKDGGDTFTNFRISESPFDPVSSVFFGDYTNITAYNNIIRPIWTRLDNTDLSVWTALVDIDALGTDTQQQPFFSMEQNYPNPFNNKTYISFKLHKQADVTLKVYNMFGNEVTVLIDNMSIAPGKYTEQFDAAGYDLKPGIYCFSLITNEYSITKKMVLSE